VGDSKVVIAWLDNKDSLKVCAIEGWKLRLKEMVKDFEYIRLDHIHREFNTEADYLSKQASNEPEGGIMYYTWHNNREGEKNTISIY
jgi:hypothetical protein